jgi:hypothetical protein
MPSKNALTKLARQVLLTPCRTDEDLHRCLQWGCGIHVPRQSVCAGHCAPFDYIRQAYFEPATDLVVWAPRGGGKTRLAAAATLLDLLHKPGISIRILGGSLQQSFRLWDHLTPDLEERLRDQLETGRARGGTLRLKNGSSVGVLAQSQRAVRGLRVQKLRCDEVELFDPQIWEAAQLVTRSSRCPSSLRPGLKGSADSGQVEAPRGAVITGTVEAISTLHKPFGLMNRIVENTCKVGTPVLRWCLMEVLERCPAERACATCLLWNECGGAAKTRCDGFVSIDDAIRIKQRVSLDTWESEMLCRRPSRRGLVFPTFDRCVHVTDREPAPGAALSLALDFGFHNPFVCLWIATTDAGATHVLDEYVQSGRTVEEHVVEIESRQWGRVPRIACDPAGAARNEQTAESNVKLLRRRGYTVRTRASRIVDGIEMVRAALMTADGAVRLRVNPRCVRLIKAMQAYSYAPDGAGELPVKDGEHDHLIDALRYHFINRQSSAAVGRRY